MVLCRRGAGQIFDLCQRHLVRPDHSSSKQFLIVFCYQVIVPRPISQRKARETNEHERRRTEAPHPMDMLYKITIEPEYLSAELFNRESMDETREFLQVVAGAAMKHQRSRVIISVHY